MNYMADATHKVLKWSLTADCTWHHCGLHLVSLMHNTSLANMDSTFSDRFSCYGYTLA